MSQKAKEAEAGPPLMAAGGEFMTVPEACRVVRLSRAKVYQLMDAGELAFAKFGRARRIPRRSLEKYVERCMVGTGNPT
jgi:excisionase family DNA binding protein